MDVYEKLQSLGLTLPELPAKGGIYKPVKQVGNFLFVSGQGSRGTGVPAITGKLGRDRSIEEGQEAARICVLKGLSFLHDYLKDLNKIKGLVRTLVFVNSAEGFYNQPQVADGASQLMVDLFGEEAGLGARAAIGVSELPGNISVEIEFIFEI